MRVFAAWMPLLVTALAAAAPAQTVTVTGQVTVQHVRKKNGDSGGNANVVVWLEPLGAAPAPPPDPPRYRMLQSNKHFHPHVLALPVGAVVEFPNQDPFFHNVFSLYKGKKFDLGLYEAGSSRTVRFERPGISFVFCNIHPQMNAYVLALETPYFATSDATGRVRMANVPPGRYRLQVWYERAESRELAKSSREVVISGADSSLGTIAVRESEHFVPPHTDKYGRAYESDRVPY